MADILGTPRNFRSLSMRDLLYARDLYHYHLLNKVNVVGTAVGLYLIRRNDPYPESDRDRAGGGRMGQYRPRGERTLENSEVREYSWPCVLVLVRKWVDEGDFGGRGGLHPEEMVPKTLYLPDGRMVPVCVVKVEPGEPDPGSLPEWHWPSSLFGGGVPIEVESQGMVRRATADCLVTDGHTTFALTSRHVCGASGEPVYSIRGGRRVMIGRASSRHLTRLPFSEVYPEFPGQRTFVNLDVGLIELDNLNDWTSQVFGLGRPGALADLNELNITTLLIDQPVVAAGAASGRLEGRIKGLFYRFKSVGGYDYVSDFLIAPRALDAEPGTRSSQTQPGDSGTVWHLVTGQERTRKDRDWTEDDDFTGELRPLAIEWGGQVFLRGGGENRFAFALATSLTTVSRVLDVELVLEHNTGVLPYWGQMGHYSIATFARNALKAGKLKDLITANLDRISFGLADLTPKEIRDRLREARETGGFVPLADVPDIIWKKHKSQGKGGRDDRWAGPGRSSGPEHPTHYADIDEPRAEDGKTLRQLCLDHPANLSVAFWQSFYDEAGHTEQSKRGLLPFRVWQFFNAMKEFAAAKDVAGFVCAAGILSHYVGDACQPLHGSVLADGFPDGPGKGVHSTYETKMIDRHARDVVTGIDQALSGGEAIAAIGSGKGAAQAIIALMQRSAERIPPEALVNAFVDAGGRDVVAVQDALWEQFGEATAEVMADGARVLAKIWAAAWKSGDGDTIPTDKLGAQDLDSLQSLYEDLEFVPSLDLDHIASAL